MDKTEKRIINFDLQKIKIEQFAIFEENYKKGGEIYIGRQIKIKTDDKLRMIGIVLSLSLVQESKTFLKMDVSCHFIVDKESWDNILMVDSSKIILPKEFIIHLISITIGTTRGVLFAKTEDSCLSGFILPPIDTSDMLEKNLEINLDNTE